MCVLKLCLWGHRIPHIPRVHTGAALTLICCRVDQDAPRLTVQWWKLDHGVGMVNLPMTFSFSQAVGKNIQLWCSVRCWRVFFLPWLTLSNSRPACRNRLFLYRDGQVCSYHGCCTFHTLSNLIHCYFIPLLCCRPRNSSLNFLPTFTKYSRSIQTWMYVSLFPEFTWTVIYTFSRWKLIPVCF